MENVKDASKLHYLKKKKETFFLNIQHLTEKVGTENVVLITLTVGDKKLVKGKIVDIARKDFADPVKFQEVMRSFRCHVLMKHFRAGWIVREMHEKGHVLHVHIVAVVNADVRTGFDFASYLKARRSWQAWVKSGKTKVAALAAHKRHTAAYGKSASPELKRLWRLLGNQKTAGEGRKYGFGRIEVIPVRKANPACIARYLGGYIGKDFGKALTKRRKARDVSFFGDKNLRGVWLTRSRHSVGGWLLRQKIKLFAAVNQCQNSAALKTKFGPRWFYHWQPVIEDIDLKDYPSMVVYPTLAHYERVYGPTPWIPHDAQMLQAPIPDEEKAFQERLLGLASPPPLKTDDPEWVPGQNYANRFWRIHEIYLKRLNQMNIRNVKNEGKEAFLSFDSRDSCPYGDGDSRYQWLQGFDESKALWEYIENECQEKESN